MYGNSYLLAISVMFGVVAMHPFTTYPLSLYFLQWFIRDRSLHERSGKQPSLGICVCAYNEEASIEEKLKNLAIVKEAYDGIVNVYLYNDFSSDRTADILNRYAEEFCVIHGVRRQGKSVGMNRLVAKCKEEIVLFSDANVEIEPDALNYFAAAFESPKVGCVCGSLEYVDCDREATAQISSFYWRLEEKIKELESKTGSAMGADGSLFAIRRKLYREVPNDIIDDMFTSLSILCDGYEIKHVPQARAFERAAQKTGEEFRRKKRIACRCINCFRLLTRRMSKLSVLDRYKFFSHKLVRWTCCGWLLVSAIFFTAYLSTAIGPRWTAACVFATTASLYCGHYGNLFGIRHLSEILLSFLAVGIGVVQSLFGMRYQTWQPASTAHKSPTTA